MSHVGRRIVLVSEEFFPSEAGTPFLLTQLAREWGRSGENVIAITCTPGGECNGMEIQRVGRAALRGFSVARAWRMFSNTLSLAFAARATIERGDCLVSVVGPSVLPACLAAVAASKARKYLLVVHDVYPEAAHAAGVLRRSSPLAWLWRRAFEYALTRADCVIAIGDDMHRMLATLHPPVAPKLRVIHHWAETDVIAPVSKLDTSAYNSLKGTPKFVVQYAGNFGLTHGVQALLEAADALRGRVTEADICIQFIGSGALQAAVENASRTNPLVQYLGTRPRSEQRDFLGSADVSVVAYRPGMAGTSVPSRLPGILCSGRAVLAVAEEGTDLANLVRTAELGWVVEPGDVIGLAEAILLASRQPNLVREMGARSREAALRVPSLSSAAASYVDACFS